MLGNYAQVEYEESGGSLDFTAATGGLGYNLSSTFGVELRYGQGMSDDSVQGTSFDIDKIVSVLGRLSLQNDTNITPYILAGYTRGWIDIEGGGTAKAEDFSFGAGVGFDITPKLSISAEYFSYIDKNDYDITGPSIGAMYVF